MATHRFAAAAVGVLLLLAGCGEDLPMPPDPVPGSKVLLMYDNIGPWFDGDVDEAGVAVAQGALGSDEKVVVYERMSGGNTIYELVADGTAAKGYSKKTIKRYAASEMNSLDKKTIAGVVGDVRSLFPAEHYGLAFGSHGTGWVPSNYPGNLSRRVAPESNAEPGSGMPFFDLWAERENPKTRFLSGYNQMIDVGDFGDALDEWEWDFIILDDCFMACVEALYEIRHVARYFIASPTEILQWGFPYGDVVRTIFADWNDVVGVGRCFVDYYRRSTHPHATVAVVKSSELGPLAEATRRLGLRANEVTSTEGIQPYEVLTRPGHVFYDFDDYVAHIRKDSDPGGYGAFKAQLERTVILKDHTPTFFSDQIGGSGGIFGSIVPVTHYSGLNVFIPWTQTAPLVPSYLQTEWYRAVYE